MTQLQTLHRRRTALVRDAVLSTCMHEERRGFDLAG